MDVESVCEELYGLPLNEFIPTRTDREKQAKSGGDKDLAAQIHRLAKPTLVAWLANQLAREHADEIRFLLQLGPALREATATGSGQQLRELSRQQSSVVYAVVQQARKLAGAAGHKVSQDTARGLEDTLRAALADPDAAEALAAARLTEGMQNSGLGSPTKGFGSAGPSGRSAVPGPQPAAPTVTETATASNGAPKGNGGSAEQRIEQAAYEREQAQREVEQARREVEQAKAAQETVSSAREKAVAQLETATRTVADSKGLVDRLRRELDEAQQAQSRAEEDQGRARMALDRVDGETGEVQQQLATATQRLAEANARYDGMAK